MKNEEFSKKMDSLWKQILKMRDAGQKEYARTNDDVHANFKRVGECLGISPEKALMVYLMKHIDGIIAHIDGHTSQREHVEGRITDAIVYLFLLWGLLSEPKSLCIETPYPKNSDATPVPEFEE